ncbi:MAG: PEGA domain-containing protein [Deltaproteobacteria bacterium]|nr:PEGA domain-containing protein [Deltaproteobacteria bacterium]
MRALALTVLLSLSFGVAAPLAAQETPPAATPPAPAAAATPPADTVTPPATTTPDTPPAGETLPPALVETPVTGTLSVTSTPAGKVFLDDKDTGLTTPVTDLAVPAGKHTVKVVSDDGRMTSSEFMIEGGGALSLNLNLPELEVKPAEVKPEDAPPVVDPVVATPPVAAAAPPQDWSWMTVSGWAGLGLGTIGLLAGAVVLTTPTDPEQGPLGFGLFGGGVGLVLGGAVLLYLDNELTDAPTTTAALEAPKAAALATH